MGLMRIDEAAVSYVGATDEVSRTHTTIVLSERNLLSLLVKLQDPLSARSLRIEDESGDSVLVKAEPDEEHYAERSPGPIWPAHQAVLDRIRNATVEPQVTD
jgi:hypothetical protein